MRTAILLPARFLSASFILIFMLITSFTNTGKFTITSTVFTHNGAIPSKYSCEGTGTNPPLHIGGAPSGTRSFALIVHDPDALVKNGFTHWVMWNIELDGEIPEEFKGAEQGLNSAKEQGFKGMCPPSGTHHYIFKVYALDTKLSLDAASTDKATLESAMKGHILASDELVGTYKKVRNYTTEADK